MSQHILPTPLGRCVLGFGRVNVTPPVGIYHRCWGAARHDASTGVHRPLNATVLVIQDPQSEEHILVTLDLGWLREREIDRLTQSVSERIEVSPERVVITFSHTHAGGNFDLDRIHDEGGDLIPGYLDSLPIAIADAIEQARSNKQPVELAYGVGHCDLAWNRDYWDEERQQYVCGTNPERDGDDTVMVIRVTDRNGHLIATLINYGCHPTTLAWDNTLISPDYIGAMREVVERDTGVPCVFLLGACGDLGPKDGYVGDTSVADRNGRQLGYAALSALEALTPHGTEMQYAGPVTSGATIGTWRHEPLNEARTHVVNHLTTEYMTFELPLVDLPAQAELNEKLADWQQQEDAARQAGQDQEAADCRAQVERTRRAMRRVEGVTPGQPAPYGVTLWRLGEGVFVLVSGEPYNLLQRELRVRFPDTPIIVGVLCNRGTGGYLLPADEYGKGIYQESAAVIGPGGLALVIDNISEQLRTWEMR